MFELVAGRMVSGDIYVAKGKRHLERSEWGMAYHSLEAALARGSLSEEGMVRDLFEDVCARLGVASRLPTAPGTGSLSN